MHNYTPFLKEADSYFGIVSKNLSVQNKLGNKVLFSISSMVIEKYLVALLLSKGVLASGHTIGGLIENTKEHVPNLPSEIKKLQTIDNQMDLCSFDAVSTPEITNEEMNKLFIDLSILKDFVHVNISERAN